MAVWPTGLAASVDSERCGRGIEAGKSFIRGANDVPQYGRQYRVHRHRKMHADPA